MTRQSRWLLILVALVFGTILLAWIDFQGFDAESVAFDSKQWITGRDQIKQNNDPGCVLGGMALYLQEKGLLTQMPQQEVFSLLGSPDSGRDKSLVWELGQCNGWGLKHSQLKITLDANGRVKAVDLQESLL